MMTFRQATPADTACCWTIMQQARRRMVEANRTQWRGEYPSQHDVESDILQGIGYVLSSDTQPLAYGAVITTGEPAYNNIDGKWLSSKQAYIVLHRLCIADSAIGQGLAKHFFARVEQFAKVHGIKYFRVDTNYDNIEMLHLLPSIGFEYCGEVLYDSGSRKAFEKVLSAATEQN